MAYHLPSSRFRTAETGLPPGYGFPPLRRILSAPKDGTCSVSSLTLTPETMLMLLKNALV